MLAFSDKSGLLALSELGANSSIMRPSDKRRTLWRDMTKLRRAGYGLRFRYVKLVVVLVATQACLATVCVSCRRDVRYIIE
jgi:hypothetical protein